MHISSVITKTIQLLVILVIGIYTRKRGFISRDTVTSLSKFLSNVTSPLLILCSFQRPYNTAILRTGLMIILGSFIIHLASAVISYFVFKPKKGPCENAVYEFNTIFANCAFMGFPILMAIYGDELGVMYGSFYNIMFHLFFWTYGIVILTRHKKKENEHSGLNIVKLIFNPGVLFTIVGFLLFVFSIEIPDMILGGLKMVGDSTFPLAMIIIGALVVELDIKSIFNDAKLYICSFLKLILIPLATLAMCLLCGVSVTVTDVLVILAGMPAATFGAIFAELYGVNPVTSAKVVCVTTIMSVATIPLLMYIVHIAFSL